MESGIHPKDLLWVANSKDEQLGDVVAYIFDSIFHQMIDAAGDSVYARKV